MQRNYVADSRHRQQLRSATPETAKDREAVFTRKWEQMHQGLEMELRYRRCPQDYPPDDFPFYQKFIHPMERDIDLGLHSTPIALIKSKEEMLEFGNNDKKSCKAAYSGNASISSVPEDIIPERVVQNLTAVGRFLEMVQSFPLPRMSFTAVCICFLLAIFISPRSCAQTFLFPVFRLSFGTLYPAYASYKAVRTKNVKEYVKWMMYWIVYAFFTCIETFTDIFLSWFPFYYEVKVIIVLWLLSPATKGSSTLYRKFVHPMLTRREQEIDDYLNQAKERGYSAVLQLGSKGVNYATNVIMQTALKTINFGLNSNNDQHMRSLPTSQSDNAIYARSFSRDEHDAIAAEETLWVQRSSSVNKMSSLDVEFSEEDDQLQMEEYTEEVVTMNVAADEIGAARLREAPKRKTKPRASKIAAERNRPRVAAKTNQKTVLSVGIRGRRKLRDSTPDADVDVE